MVSQSRKSRIGNALLMVGWGALPFYCSICASSARAQTEFTCTLFADVLVRQDDPALDTIVATIECATELQFSTSSDAEPDLTQLHFPAMLGEQLIIGASLTDEAPSVVGEIEAPTPDFDFPVRFITVPGDGEVLRWNLHVESNLAGEYAHLIMRVWNPAALAECQQGRDGCEKFGYVLLWDQRRVEDALELALK